MIKTVTREELLRQWCERSVLPRKQAERIFDRYWRDGYLDVDEHGKLVLSTKKVRN